MNQRIRNRLVEVLLMLALGLAAALVMPRGYAAMIGTDTAQASAERERVKALVARPELAQQMEKLGVLPRDAASRVDAMSDEEVARLAGRLDSLLAGGATLTTDQLIIILLVVLLIAILI